MALRTTYWYGLRVSWPPMRIDGTFWMNTLAPRMLETLGRSSRTTCSAGFLWANGLRLMVMRPMLSELEMPPAPTKDITASTFGSWRTISAT